MLLVLSNSSDATADYGCKEFTKAGVRFVRLDTDTISSRAKVSYGIDGPRLHLGNQILDPKGVTGVWFRRPEPLLFDGGDLDERETKLRAAEWQAALQGFFAHIPVENWINHPANNAQASHKLEQLTRAKTHGLRVPRSILSQDADTVNDFWASCNRRIIIKPLALGYIEAETLSDGIIYTREVEESHLEDLDLLGSSPCFFQERIEKSLDVRVTVIDGAVVAVGMEHVALTGEQVLDVRRDDMRTVRYRKLIMPAAENRSLLQLLNSYGLRFAAVDFVIDQHGSWTFLEINPNGQWAWLDLEAGTRIVDLLANAARSEQTACQRN